MCGACTSNITKSAQEARLVPEHLKCICGRLYNKDIAEAIFNINYGRCLECKHQIYPIREVFKHTGINEKLLVALSDQITNRRSH